MNSKLFSFLIVVSAYFTSVKASNKPKVCVIGAGQAGLSMARFVSQHKDEFKLVVIEKNQDIGGQWLYSDNLVDQFNMTVHSSVYKNMITNGPTALMHYPDFRFHDEFSGVQPRQAVLEYLRYFTQYFNLRQYIKFNTLVTKVSPLVGRGGYKNAKWLVQFRKPHSRVVGLTVCDAIAVCNGHESKPNIPSIPGIETFPGILMHSHFYRNPEDFTNKTVLLLGAQFSGVDISLELSRFAKLIYLSHNKAKIENFPPIVIQVSGLVAVNGSTLTLKDGTTMNSIDAVILCTGYLVDYPFLDKESKISITKNYVYPLWRHIVNAEYPTMGFISLRHIFHFYASSFAQAQYFTALLRGKVSLPSKSVMLKEIEKDTPEMYYANVDTKFQWELEDLLIREAGIQGTPSLLRNASQQWLVTMFTEWATFKSYFIRINEEINEVDVLIPKKFKNSKCIP